MLSSVNDGPGIPYKKAIMPSGFFSHQLEDRESPGAIKFMTFCMQCHSLPDPKLHSAKEWPAVVVNMMDKMQRKALYKRKSISVPKNEEVDQIIAYLSLHGLRDVVPTPKPLN